MARCQILTLLVVLFALAPCQARAPKPRAPSAQEKDPGIIFVVGGVGGLDLLGATCNWVLPKVGVTHEIRNFDWQHGKGHVLLDLQDTRHFLAKARELADLIEQARQGRPDRPVYLIAHSAGAGLVLAAAEMLPEKSVSRIILLSAAVAPRYDLRPALRATRMGIVSFHSKHDTLVLGWGTKKFGTVDRFYGPSAGLTSFVVPADLEHQDVELYSRLIQLAWRPSLIMEGHTGGHHGTVMPWFISKEVVPWLKP